MDPLRLLVYDTTCRGGPRRPGLSHAWSAGSWLYRRLGRLDAVHPATSWADALGWLATVEPARPIGEIQYWGHGRWGRALIGDDVLDASALAPDHPLHPLLVTIRARLVPGGRALWWWRTCETFGARAGHDFAIRWTRFFDCTSAGHTYVIGVWQSGLRVLRPGEAPAWDADEGLRDGTADAPVTALVASRCAVDDHVLHRGASLSFLRCGASRWRANRVTSARACVYRRRDARPTLDRVRRRRRRRVRW